MSTDQFILFMQHVETMTEMALSLGVHLQIGSDFNKFREVSSMQPLKPHINPAFDPACSDISSRNSFWIIGKNDAGEVVHTQAIKLLDLTGSNLNDHFRTRLGDYRSHGYNFDMQKSNCFLTRAAARMSGRISYHGELWIKGGPNGFRGGCLATILTRLMMTVCVLRWSPDFLIGLQSPMTSCRGLATREGYMHVEQRSIVWRQIDCEVVMEDWLVWMSREEAYFNLRVSPETFFRLFENYDFISKRTSRHQQKIA